MNQSSELKNFSTSSLPLRRPRPIYKEIKRRYEKISKEKRADLFRLVLKDGKRVKEAALLLNLKYASAKTIVYKYREQRRAPVIEGTQTCGYTDFHNRQQSVINLTVVLAQEFVKHECYKFVS
ncbi:hypothetical protein pb186bvf_012754 [Paramecium bursaria]